MYSTEERALLAWLSHHYEGQRKVIWGENSPPTRWIVSFDNDLLDGLVLATLLSAYAPFLVSTQHNYAHYYIDATAQNGVKEIMTRA